MAVYDGVPSIRLEGDEGRALALIPEAKALLYKVQTFKKRAGVGTFSMSRRVDDDSTIYVLSALEQNVIQISVAPDVPEEVRLTEAPSLSTLFPDFYSGLVFDGFMEERVRMGVGGGEMRYNVCDSFSPTPTCVRTHDELTPGRQLSPRLAVLPDSGFPELTNRSPHSRREFTQYARLRSSMYSGTMKKVAQIAMGLGHIGKAKLRDPSSAVPDTPYVRDVDAYGVRIRYDWRFMRTHGITVGADGRLWLVEISSARGVLARLLPIFPRSATAAFRARAEARNDTAMTFAIDELGCVPTGECFPAAASAVEALIARGDVLRLMSPSELSRFYSCSAYSSAMGWAFNDRGNEAHNTGYYYGEDGFQRGVWYQVNIAIGPVSENRAPGEPIAAGTANLRINAEGFLYAPPVPPPSWARYVPIKFHEPMLGGLLSHEAVPSIEAEGLPPPKVDTPMFVSFVNGDLKVVKYYRNPKRDTFNHVDDPRYPGECMYNGSWTITEVSGDRSFPSMMYTNDFDDRKVLQEHVKTTNIQSVDAGYDAPIRSMEINYDTYIVARYRCFKNTTVVEELGGERVVSAIVVPQYSREAYYYATARTYDLYWRGSTTVGYSYVADPNYARSWGCTENFGIPLPPDLGHAGTRLCRGDAYCYFRDAFQRPLKFFHPEQRVVQLFHGAPRVTDPCADFADSGQWLELCQDVSSIRVSTSSQYEALPVRRGEASSWDKSGESEASLRLVTPGHGGPIDIPISATNVFTNWLRPSPDEYGMFQYLPATHSGIGDDAVVYGTGLSSSEFGGGASTRGYLPDNVAVNDGYPAFVGVNRP